MNRKLIEKVDALLLKEKGTVFKDPGGRVTVCLVYPNTYHVGMSNLGFQGIYGFLNRDDAVVCERAFLPPEEDTEEYRRTGTPLFSFESKKPLGEFDIVAFSVSFENDYPHIMRILDYARIPHRPALRTGYHPLLIAGGVCASFNPEPFAEVFDIIFIGEAEESLSEFLKVYQRETERRTIKEKALGIGGIYVPEFYNVRYGADGRIAGRNAQHRAPERITRRYIRDLSQSPLTAAIVTPETEFSDMCLIEAMRGCPWSCRFCLVGSLYKPPRRKGLDVISKEIANAREITPRIGIIGPSLTDYPYIKDILCIDGVDFSITSLRASAKSTELVELIKGRRSVSIAPEAGTERLRAVINKRITENDIMDISVRILDAGIENLRLYFMIGLPTETGEDIAGIIGLVRRVRQVSQKGNIILSVSTFVPKPFTPFQWSPMEELSSTKEKIRFIKREALQLKNVRVFHDVPKYARMQGLFSLGDRRVLKVLEGMRVTEDWTRACVEAGVDEEFYLSRKKEAHETLPWDFIDMGVSKEALWVEYQRALSY